MDKVYVKLNNKEYLKRNLIGNYQLTSKDKATLFTLPEYFKLKKRVSWLDKSESENYNA